ncbi:MAG: hypothetical protein ACHREM_10640 [Polyangiales bacterium]
MRARGWRSATTRSATGVGSLLAIACAISACPAPPPKPVAVPIASARPPPPPPPVTVRKPIVLEGVDATRSEVRWEQDYRRARWSVSYDIVLAQEQAVCPHEEAPKSLDAIGCPGAPTFSPACTDVKTNRARTSLTITRSLDFEVRCSGDTEGYALPEGDARAALTASASECFQRHNRFKPEASWQSLYALTELRIVEGAPKLIGELAEVSAHAIVSEERRAHSLPVETQRYCRDDVAYLDGIVPTIGAARADEPAIDATIVADALARMTPLTIGPVSARSLGVTPPKPWSVPVTGDGHASEQSLWEACAAPQVKDQLVVQERCLLLRQLDRLMRDAEDQARPATPRGTASATPTPSASGSAR